jgi:hypothetical protein
MCIPANQEGQDGISEASRGISVARQAVFMVNAIERPPVDNPTAVWQGNV